MQTAKGIGNNGLGCISKLTGILYLPDRLVRAINLGVCPSGTRWKSLKAAVRWVHFGEHRFAMRTGVAPPDFKAHNERGRLSVNKFKAIARYGS